MRRVCGWREAAQWLYPADASILTVSKARQRISPPRTSRKKRVRTGVAPTTIRSTACPRVLRTLRLL